MVIQLKLFIPTFVNGQFVPNKITDLKLGGVPTSILEIAGAQYKTQAAILHMGENTSSGLYIAYPRQGTSNWICANDNSCRKKIAKQRQRCICYHSKKNVKIFSN
ncbi:ubiquitin carboxyl-terminal hydrolase 25-like [Aphis craccivora]|uniref:Ubiquitin carboxyl-terminal hydrolase 25-like n=1 Tax=Aphis craccivora TaxID=307492 RepID=A0A6G0VJN3_APHCR|nr:ubiquitin carboxyl-terminal hydrolase 25-like [Aphis craccivora]